MTEMRPIKNTSPNASADAAVGLTRRSLIQGSAAMATALSAPAAAFQAFLAKPAHARRMAAGSDYGPLVEVADANTGLPLLKLPQGFDYLSFGITGDRMADGTLTPGGHDGMAVIRGRGRHVTLVRNHELSSGPAFGRQDTPVFDDQAGGGTTNLVFDTRHARLVEDWASLSGTIRNCAGGHNPLGRSWLTCEETTASGHGYIFEVPAKGTASAVPIKDAGRFSHEAVAVDPRTGIVYETEDAGICGFYRYVPDQRHDLESGGRLQMARVRGSSFPVNLNGGNPGRNELATSLDLPVGDPIAIGESFPIEWVDIARPDPGIGEPSVVAQGIEQGGAVFTRGEGAWYSAGSVFWVSTDGGEARQGQIWEYNIREERMTLIFESTDPFALNNPDNITVAPSGSLLLCEDGGAVKDEFGAIVRGEQLVGLTPDGMLFPFAENNIVIPDDRPVGGRAGDQRTREWAGATFTFDGEWLFANIQTPGITFAITGPWERGPLGGRRERDDDERGHDERGHDEREENERNDD